MAWKAIQHWQFHNRSIKFGENFIPKTKWQTSWTPSSVVWMYKTLEQKKIEKLSNSANSISVNSSDNFCPSAAPPASSSRPVPKEKNAHKTHVLPIRKAADTVCFYGHKVSSSTDYRGRQSWRYSPIPPWPSVPPDRPLCQRCFLCHRTAALQGKSQYDFPHLYLYQRQNINPINSGGASSSTERPPG